MQFSLDFSAKIPPAEQVRIAEGMAAADEHANSKWKRVIDGCILAVARKQATLTVDDVLAEMERVHGAPSTHNLAAIGPAMRRAAQDGILSRTDQMRRSTREKKHGNLHSVWKSNYYEGLGIRG